MISGHKDTFLFCTSEEKHALFEQVGFFIDNARFSLLQWEVANSGKTNGVFNKIHLALCTSHFFYFAPC